MKIIRDDSCSLPLVGVSSGYLASPRIAQPYDIIGEPVADLDHILVVLRADEDTVSAFDSLARFNKGGRGIRGVVEITTPLFMTIWNEARCGSQWCMFIRFTPEKDRMKEGLKTLDEYGELK